jgi:hypothetical protein
MSAEIGAMLDPMPAQQEVENRGRRVAEFMSQRQFEYCGRRGPLRFAQSSAR